MKANYHLLSGMSINREIWIDFFKEFDRTKEHPTPLQDLKKPFKKVLFFGKPQTNATRCLRDIFPILGDGVFVSEYDYIDKSGQLLEDDFAGLIEHHAIDLVLFPNPYGNEARLSIYSWCRKTGVPYFCFERGALPDSWFFDSSGFNADSSSYKETRWAKELDEGERKNINEYIKYTLAGYNSLEKQGVRFGGDGLKSQLQTGGKKVLFVPLQRPSDTVIRYFRGELASYDAFLSFIDQAAKQLKRKGWVVLCKKHPLETETLPLNYAQYVTEDTNFIDLLELSDAVALINSGVGVYSMMLKKPTYLFGDAFYYFADINKKASINSVEIFTKQVMNGYTVDYERVEQFIHYLKNSFYSYGTSKTKVRKEVDGSLRNLTTGIDFYSINILGKEAIMYSYENRAVIPNTAPLYERFALDLHNKKNKENQVKLKL